nr:reverse transcriptase domain-containing protein [Tanacetum cinerariifolium]
MCIDELHKFSDGTLNDVRTALDDRLKGIQMKYLPQAIWRKSDKERAATMIQVIDKKLKTRRIMRSLEKLLVGDCTRETSGCFNGPYDLSYDVLIFQRRSNRRRIPNIVEPEIQTIKEIVSMVDRTMKELLQAPMEGYEEAIVIPKILAENFEIKTNLLQLVQANKFHGFERDNPHTHISNFKRMTGTLKYRDVLNDAIKLMLFLYSLEGAARIYFFQNQPLTSGTLLSNTMPNPKGEMKDVTTRSGLAYEGPSIPTESPLEKVDEQNTKEILDKEHSNSSGSTAQVQPSVVPISIPEHDVSRTQTKPTISYLSSFVDALFLMPKFASTIKNLLAKKDKIFELAKVQLNENCSAMLLKKLPEKLGDPGKFLIPCDFLGMKVCHALADLSASINLMPLSIWKKISLPELTPTQMTLELADRSISHPKGVIEDVFFKVGKFHFPTHFVVVDFEADPRVSLILGRSFLRIGRALINAYGEEITLRDPIVKTSPFGEFDFFLEEIEDFFVYDPEGDILYFENLLKDDLFQLSLMNLNQAKSPIKEPDYSFSMGYEHLSTTLVTELDEVTESSIENLVPILSEYEVTSDNESEYEVPIKDDSSPAFINPLFNDMDDFTSNDNESIPEEDVPIEEFKDYSNPLFDNDEINSDELESHCLNVESNFVESLSNHDTLKFDHLEEFSRALMLFDNDSPREEIDIVTDMDELLPLGFENDDSEGEINVVEELLVDNFIPKSENELSDFDYDDPLFPRPSPEPPDVEFDFEPNSGEVISAVMNNIDEFTNDECFDI